MSRSLLNFCFVLLMAVVCGRAVGQQDADSSASAEHKDASLYLVTHAEPLESAEPFESGEPNESPEADSPPGTQQPFALAAAPPSLATKHSQTFALSSTVFFGVTVVLVAPGILLFLAVRRRRSQGYHSPIDGPSDSTANMFSLDESL
jgi:uncharacterized membrane protein